VGVGEVLFDNVRAFSLFQLDDLSLKRENFLAFFPFLFKPTAMGE
jgi:hypothetical protein